MKINLGFDEIILDLIAKLKLDGLSIVTVSNGEGSIDFIKIERTKIEFKKLGLFYFIEFDPFIKPNVGLRVLREYLNKLENLAFKKMGIEVYNQAKLLYMNNENIENIEKDISDEMEYFQRLRKFNNLLISQINYRTYLLELEQKV